MVKISMLIVDDSAAVGERLRGLMQSLYPDADVRTAGTGAQAIALFREHRPQLVLMDIDLPDANGIALTAQIKAMGPGTAVIVISGHPPEAYAALAHKNGAFAYIAKNAIGRELAPTVAAALHLLTGESDE